MVQGKVFIPLRRPDGGIEPAADTNLRIGAEGGLLAALEAADGGQQSQHPLLDQILAVAACQKKRAGTHSHQTCIAADQLGLCQRVAGCLLYTSEMLSPFTTHQ